MALIGMGGNLTIGAVSYPVENWTCNITNDVQLTTDTGTGGWDSRIPGVSSGEFSCTMFYNQTLPQLAALAVGASFTFSGQIGTIAPTQDTVAGTFIISGISVENPAKNPVKLNITAQSNGAVVVTAAP